MRLGKEGRPAAVQTVSAIDVNSLLGDFGSTEVVSGVASKLLGDLQTVDFGARSALGLLGDFANTDVESLIGTGTALGRLAALPPPSSSMRLPAPRLHSSHCLAATPGASASGIVMPDEAIVEMVDASRADGRPSRADRVLNGGNPYLIMFCAVGMIAPLVVAGVGGGPEDVAGAFFSSILSALLYLADCTKRT